MVSACNPSKSAMPLGPTSVSSIEDQKRQRSNQPILSEVNCQCAFLPESDDLDTRMSPLQHLSVLPFFLQQYGSEPGGITTVEHP